MPSNNPIDPSVSIFRPRDQAPHFRAAHERDSNNSWGSMAGMGAAMLFKATQLALGGAHGSSGMGGIGGMGGGGGDPNALLIKQMQLQREMQIFTMKTNVAKTEHETKMAAVRNLRA